MPPTKQRQSRTGRRIQCFFYLTPQQHDAMQTCLRGETVSSYAAGAVLQRLAVDGVRFYGDFEGGTCSRADPVRGEKGMPVCATGLPATMWNRFAQRWVCPTCATELNQMEPGMCVASPDGASDPSETL